MSKIKPNYEYLDFNKRCASTLMNVRINTLKLSKEKFLEPFKTTLAVYQDYEDATKPIPLEFLHIVSEHYKIDISNFIPDTEDLDHLLKTVYEAKSLLSYFVILISELSDLGTDLISPRVLKRIEKL
jgi:hypothetical protein